MDIEKLTKSQIVLLTLLISFVTSIATGIVTVSLMQQAPPAVAETVERVIENTIETVATSTKSQSAAAVVTTQKTIVVNEADLVSQSVKQISPSVVRLYTDGADSQQFLGLGIVIDASGTVAADIGALNDIADVTIQTSAGTSIRSFVTARNAASGLLFLTPATSTSAALTWVPASIVKSGAQLGEVVVAVTGKNSLAISQGLVTQLIPGDKTAGTPATIETSVDPSVLLPGSVLIDTNGSVVGVSTSVSRASSQTGFIPASLLMDENVTNP